MDSALVTGGCGFVGRNLVRSLLEDTPEIWIIDDLSSGSHPDDWLLSCVDLPCSRGTFPGEYVWPDRRVVFLEGDLMEILQADLTTAGTTPQPSLPWPLFDAAYHLASIVGGRQKIEGEPLSIGLDLAIDSVFFLWIQARQRVKRVLYASSSAAYPVELQTADRGSALDESLIDWAAGRVGMPDMTYGWSKLTGEYLAFLLAQRHGTPTCCVRPFSGYGEDQDMTYPIPAIAMRAAKREDPLVVWGSGRQGRDFVHIDDCIAGMRLAVNTIEDGSAVNLGSGRLTTFLEVAELFAQLADYTPEIKGTETGPVGVHSRFANTSQVSDRLGWKPTVSLTEGFRRVLTAKERQLAQMGGAAR